MRGRHAGKVAVVTGAAQGLGQAFALRLGTEGADVVAIDLNPSDETVRQIETAGGKAKSIACDLGDASAIAATASAIGRCDILVNNAGLFPNQKFDAIADDDWRRVMAVNLDAPFYLIRAFAPGMKQRGWGRIVCISSTTILQAGPGSAHYITSKAGVIGLVRVMATELGGAGITVNAVSPGLVRTPGTSARFTEDFKDMAEPPDLYARYAKLQAIKTQLKPDDIAGAVSFLASEDAAFITGQTLIVDGGQVRI